MWCNRRLQANVFTTCKCGQPCRCQWYLHVGARSRILLLPGLEREDQFPTIAPTNLFSPLKLKPTSSCIISSGWATMSLLPEQKHICMQHLPCCALPERRRRPGPLEQPWLLPLPGHMGWWRRWSVSLPPARQSSPAPQTRLWHICKSLSSFDHVSSTGRCMVIGISQADCTVCQEPHGTHI